MLPDLIRLTTPEQLQRAAAVVGRAFADDPLLRYMFPNPAEWAKRVPWYFATNLKHASLFGEVYATPNFEGVAAWLSPADDHWSFERLQQSGLWQMQENLGEEATDRFMQLVEMPVPETSRPYWYLFMLGVESTRRGLGFGQRLLAPMLARIESEGAAIRVDTNDPANVPFYQRYGFELIHEGMLTPQLGNWSFRRNKPLGSLRP
jgi:ribosomal protein S18 acetylase RimI-like enzyme